MLLYDVPFSTKKQFWNHTHPYSFTSETICQVLEMQYQHRGQYFTSIEVLREMTLSRMTLIYSTFTLQKRVPFLCVFFFRLCANRIARVVPLVSVCHATIRMIDAVISASWSFPSSWRPCPRRGPLFEKPRNSPVVQNCLWTIGWSGVWVISNLLSLSKVLFSLIEQLKVAHS